MSRSRFPHSAEQPAASGDWIAARKSAAEETAATSQQSGIPLEAATRAAMEKRLGHDFSRVRVHPQAPEVTTPLRAAAVTQGQDVYYHPGKFRPDTLEGQALIAHELAHTLQTCNSENAGDRPATRISQPGDALEENADALARGETTQALAAPAGIALRSPLDAEKPAERARRETLIQSISNAIDNLLKLLRTGGLIQDAETLHQVAGVRGVTYGSQAQGTADAYFTSHADRDARMRRVLRSLMAMATHYRTTPIAAGFSAPTLVGPDAPGDYQSTVTYPPGSYPGPNPVGTSTYAGSAEQVDLGAAYERYRITQKQIGDAYQWDTYYLDPRMKIVPGAAKGARRSGSGTPSGAYMVFPDIDKEPLRYWMLTGSSPHPKGSIIVEFLHDDFGYYYEHRGQRIDVPSPWSSGKTR